MARGKAKRQLTNRDQSERDRAANNVTLLFQHQNNETTRILKTVKPITKNQHLAFKAYESGKNLWLAGAAGTGKTFIATYLALRELSTSSVYQKVYIVRSVVPTRDVGALPGTLEEKIAQYEAPYEDIFNKLYGSKKAYAQAKEADVVEFLSTSYIRGRTLDNCIVIVDETQNMSFHELDSIITRLGDNAKIVFCGDMKQSDLHKESERKGFEQFEDIIDCMQSFEIVDFYPEDIVRSGLVKEYLLIANAR